MLRQYISFLLMLCLFSCSQEKASTTTTKAKVETNTATNAPKDTPAPDAAKTKKKSILFFGDSITAGYGLDEKDAFTTLIQNRINEKGLDYSVINAGQSGETTAGGKKRIDWVLKQPVDIFVLELGGNDMLRGLDVKNAEENLTAILNTVRKKYPEIPIIVAGMMAPTNLGEKYYEAFNALFPKLAKAFDAKLIPFVLEGVAGVPELNLKDGIHPNVEGEKIVMENIWKVLETVL